MIITSNRTFGVEIEFFCNSQRELNGIQNSLKIIEDGSIRHIKKSGEYISPILRGQRGERYLQKVFEILKKNGARVDNPLMSVHIHLDGAVGGAGELKSANSIANVPAVRSPVVAVSKKLLSSLDKDARHAIVKQGLTPTGMDIHSSVFDGITYFSLAKLIRAPRLNYVYFWSEKPDRFAWLRNVLYFYTAYSDVMEGLVANSRKFGNMYCIPLGASYDLDKIEACNNEEELQSLWYNLS